MYPAVTSVDPPRSGPIAQLLRRAQSLVADGDGQRGVALLEEELAAAEARDAPPEQRVWMALGLADLFLRLDDPAGALRAAATARSAAGREAPGLASAAALRTAGILLAEDDVQGATDALEPLAAGRGPGAAEARLGLARVCCRRGRLDDAERWLERADFGSDDAAFQPALPARLLSVHLGMLRGALDEAEHLLQTGAFRGAGEETLAALARARLHRFAWVDGQASRRLLLAIHAAETAMTLARRVGRTMLAREALLHRAAARALLGESQVAGEDARRALAGVVWEGGVAARMVAVPEWPLPWVLADAALGLAAAGDNLAADLAAACDERVSVEDGARLEWLGVRSPRPVAPAADAPVRAESPETLKAMAQLVGARTEAAVTQALTTALRTLPGVAAVESGAEGHESDVDPAVLHVVVETGATELPALRVRAEDPAGARALRGSIDTLRAAAEAALERIVADERERRRLAAALRRRERVARAARARPRRQRLVADSPAMRATVGRLQSLARSGQSLVLRGEAGSGRTHLCRALAGWRREGRRIYADGRFVADRMATVGGIAAARELLGRCATALILDDADVLPEAFWPALAAVVHDEHHVPWLAAAVRTAPEASPETVFYGLGAVAGHPPATVDIPPLRERGADIPPLAALCLRRGAPRGVAPHLSVDVFARLLAYDWPGNIVELEDVIAKAAAVARGGEIEADDLPAPLDVVGGSRPPGAERGYHAAVRDFRRWVLEEALRVNDGHRTRAAEWLGIQRTYLARLLRELDVTTPLRDGRANRA